MDTVTNSTQIRESTLTTEDRKLQQRFRRLANEFIPWPIIRNIMFAKIDHATHSELHNLRTKLVEILSE